jgi:hypothetical protein
MYDDRRYVVFPVLELNLINFDQVMETDSNTVRKSVDGTHRIQLYENLNACIVCIYQWRKMLCFQV